MPKYTLQEMADMGRKGERRVYPKLDVYHLLENDKFVRQVVSYDRSLPASVLQAVLTNVADTLRRMLSEGYTVKIDHLGVFSLSLDFADQKPKVIQQEGDKMSYREVTVKNVNFKADPLLLKELQDKTELERTMSGVKVIRKKMYTPEERLGRALERIAQNGFIRLSEYASLNNLSRTAASLELKRLCEGPDSPLQTDGKGSHKVWKQR